MSARYEWVMGPIIVTGPRKVHWHAGKAVLARTGTVRLILGQVRDTELAQTFNWVMGASENALRAKGQRDDFAAGTPRAEDWMPRTPELLSIEFPKGWTAPAPRSPFERGLVI